MFFGQQRGGEEAEISTIPGLYQENISSWQMDSNRAKIHHRFSFFKLAHYISLSLTVSELFTLHLKHVSKMNYQGSLRNMLEAFDTKWPEIF